MARSIRWLWLLPLAATASLAAGQATRPADPPAVQEVVIGGPDSFLEQSPAEPVEPDDPQPDPEPVNPFGRGAAWSRPDSRPGVVTMSDGTTVAGYIFTTRGRGWRLYDPNAKKYRDIPTIILRRIDAVVLWQRMEDDWRFARMGDDEKIYTGHKYPNRMLEYKFTLINGRTLQGAIAQPLSIEWHNERTKLMLHKRQKGELDQTLEQMPYLASVEFSAEKMTQVRDEQAAARAASRPVGPP